jgi:alkanesulfonate monooxygenase SsuD/methylene tetrahydromethanopterin reductase-like flavin-dependent oxidoreductase (luciferase family)
VTIGSGLRLGMHVGLLSLGDLITDPVTGERRTHAQRHRNLVDQAVAAEAVGFHSIHLGEHHFCDYILSAPPVVLAAIAERTTTLRLSTGVALGVNLDPIRIAEDYATVDVLSGGRVEPCIGRGTFFPHTYDVFGQDATHAKDMFAEHLEILVNVWEHEQVSWSGTHHSPLSNVTVMPRPVQTPRPPIWAGVGASADSIDLAARLGLWIMLPTVFGTIDMFRRAVDYYEARWDHYGHPAEAKRIGCCTHTYIHESSQRAREIWEPRYRAYIEWVNHLQMKSSGGTNPGLGGFDFETLIANTAMCGSPQQIIDRMGQIKEALHLDTQLLMFDMGGLPDAELFEAIELTGKEVIPTISGMCDAVTC